MISFDEAIAVIGSVVDPVPAETVSLRRAADRVLAAPVIAAIDSPRADVSAMDGYALRSADLHSFPVVLDVAGQSLPGMPWTGSIEPGTCLRIFTGAPVPQGADRIVVQEQVRRDGNRALIETAVDEKTWIRRRAADFSAGDRLAGAGQLIDPGTLIAIAGGDVPEVLVSPRIRLALLITGDELVEAGEARSTSFAVPESVSHGVTALAGRWGADVVHCARLRDDLEAMKIAATEAAANSDLIVVTGGASVGERDFAKAMFGSLELHFSRIAMRPGMPAWFGHSAGRPVLGLPGNPTSALVTARLLLAPLLARMQGRSVMDALSFERASLTTMIPACDGRETFHRACLARGEASLLSFQESHAQKSLADANALIRQPALSSALAIGEAVEVLKL